MRMNVEHNKAVRDRIPEEIGQKGGDCRFRILPDQEFLEAMEDKIGEELEEYRQSKSVEEIADLIEVLYRVAELKGTSREELDTLIAEKRERRGGFDHNIFLIEVR
ncbi:MAG: phosphoribosyl-ATP pyrophosphohydrolase [Methanomassiliicoccales archaeon]